MHFTFYFTQAEFISMLAWKRTRVTVLQVIQANTFYLFPPTYLLWPQKQTFFVGICHSLLKSIYSSTFCHLPFSPYISLASFLSLTLQKLEDLGDFRWQLSLSLRFIFLISVLLSACPLLHSSFNTSSLHLLLSVQWLFLAQMLMWDSTAKLESHLTGHLQSADFKAVLMLPRRDIWKGEKTQLMESNGQHLFWICIITSMHRTGD